MAVTRQSPTLKPREAKALREFVTFAASEWAQTQTELASITGISQAMIAQVISGTKTGGGRTLRALSTSTGIPMDEILSGAGLLRLRSKGQHGVDRKQTEQRTRAAEALAKLFDVPFGDIIEIFDELGVSLPAEVPATTWFDVGRAAIERRAAGLALTRRLSP